MFQKLDHRSLFIALCFAYAVCAYFIVTTVSDLIWRLALLIFMLCLAWLSSKTLTSSDVHRHRNIRLCIVSFSATLSLFSLFDVYTESLLLWIANKIDPALATNLQASASDIPSYFVITCALIFFLATIYFISKPSSAVLGRPPVDPFYREPSYLERLETFVAVLKSHLGRVDEELRWHHRHFVELKAEVDIMNSSRKSRRVVDLLEALKRNTSANIFVVLGVPGAGKSVALRKCCIDLLDAWSPRQRLPIYINLKEWVSNRTWSSDTPPTSSDFSDFVRNNVLDRLPDHSKSFFHEHFDRLFQTGQLFFIFDSFDEIPGILDADEASLLLGKVSDLISGYIKSNASSRGIIASRYYRKPNLGHEPHGTLEVRPFSERQISKVLRGSAVQFAELQRALFAERTELGSMARNPFSLNLIMLYWNKNRELPPTQAALYENYISDSLDDAGETIKRLKISKDETIAIMEDISWIMFNSTSLGLEITTSDLRRRLQRDDIDIYVDVMVSARLARRAAFTGNVSFVHRRFNEFFLVKKWLSGEAAPPLEAIPADSRYRDALVLYAEVASDEEAAHIAEFCWEEIRNLSETSADGVIAFLRAIHALRFVAEAFRARTSAIGAFREELGQKVVSILSDGRDLMTSRVVVEAVGLLDFESMMKALLSALRVKSIWIQEAAFRSCRFLPQIPQSIEREIYIYLRSKSIITIVFRSDEDMFLLESSESLSKVRGVFSLIRIDIIFGVLSTLFVYFIGFCLLGGRSINIFLFSSTYIFMVLLTVPLFGRGGFGLKFFRNRYLEAFEIISPSMLNIDSLLVNSIIYSKYGLLIVSLLPGLGVIPADHELKFIYFEEYVQSHFYVIGICTILSTPIFVSKALFGYLSNFSLHNIFLSLRRRKLKLFAFLILLLSISMIGYGAVLAFLSLSEEIREYIFSAIAFMAFLFTAKIAYDEIVPKFREVFRWYGDRKRWRSRGPFSGVRAEIAQDYQCFASFKYRVKYVNWLEEESRDSRFEERLSNMKENPWPSSGRPSFGGIRQVRR